jgi:hypothetical protein
MGVEMQIQFNVQILAGSGLYWKHVNGSPGGVIAGTEHNGHQTNAICRTENYHTGEYYVGKDWGGHCFFPGLDWLEHVTDGNDYDVLYH